VDSRQKRHFDLQQRLVEFSCTIIDIVEDLPDTRVGNHVAGQLLRSGTSPAPNYAEATSAESRQDFIHKMKISLKELRETGIWLNVIKKRGLVKRMDKVDLTMDECQQLTSIFVTSISTAKRNLKSASASHSQ
jgi:four helix bundle protein